MIAESNEVTFNTVSRNGRLLCSPRNPVKEAVDWLKRQNITSEDRSVLVLGYGAGFHVHELKKQFPNLNIHILELDMNYNNVDFQFVTNPNMEEYDAILSFRPAWAGMEEKYLKLYLQLTGRDQNPDSFFSEFDEQKIWYCLRELIK